MTEGDATRDRLEQELAQVRAQRQQLIEDLGGEDPASPDVGDQGDAAQELEGLDDLSRLNRRVDELQRRIADPGAYPESGLPDGTVVTVRFPDGDQTTYRVVTIPGEAPGNDEVLTA